MIRFVVSTVLITLSVAAAGCHRQAPSGPPRASGYVEATEIKVASKVAGRVEQVNVTEGQRVTAAQVLVTVATTDIDLVISQARADRDQALAQLHLLQAGSRREDVRQAEAQGDAHAGAGAPTTRDLGDQQPISLLAAAGQRGPQRHANDLLGVAGKLGHRRHGQQLARRLQIIGGHGARPAPVAWKMDMPAGQGSWA